MKFLITLIYLTGLSLQVFTQEAGSHAGEMKDGKYVGKHTWYYPGGQIQAEVTYTETGTWTRVRTWDAAGDLIDDEYAGTKYKKKQLPELAFSFEEDGLGYVLLPQNRSENEPFPSEDDKVFLRYEGYLLDGTIFDSNIKGKALKFRLGRGGVIAGFDQAVRLLKVGDTGYFYIPWNMAYGSQMVGTIPPYSNLIFQITLEDLNSSGKR